MSLDPVARLRMIAAGLDGAAFAEALLDAPYPAVWALVSDLERGVPRFEPSVVAVEIIERSGDQLRVIVRTQRDSRIPMEVLLRDGYCLMQSEHASIGMAASPEGDKTRFAHFEHVPDIEVRQEKLVEELRTIELLSRGVPDTGNCDEAKSG
jgi:hypothetical protein